MSLTAKLALTPVLVAQALYTRVKLPRLPEPEGERLGVLGRGRRQWRLLIVGDSSAAGVGVARQEQALAGPLARRFAQAASARVAWRLVAQSGWTTAQTLQQLQREHVGFFDLAVAVTGVNDVVEQVPSQRAVSAREALANHRRNALGVHHVAFAPLPPVHHFPGLPQPLRWVAGNDALRHNDAMAEWVQTRDDVSLVPMALALETDGMATDGFHPGEPVYRYCSEAIATHLAQTVLPRISMTETPR